MTVVLTQQHAMSEPKRDKLNGFHSIFLLGFVLFLPIVAIGRLIPRRWRPRLPGADGDRSILRETASGVYTFMSYLA